MPNLGELSAARIGAGLTQIIAEWPSGDLPTQLRAGRDAALAAIRRFVPSFHYDVSAADQAGRDIDAWAERNEEGLATIMQSSETALPAALQLEMGSSRAQSFVLASFTQAAAGLGPWDAGEVARQAQAGELINERWARADAADRLETFALIVQLERDGSLEKIFVPPSGGASGLGLLPVWAVVVVLVVVAAALVVLILGWRRLSLNNRLLRDICERAAKDGREEVLRACIKATENLTVSPLEKATTEFAAKVGTGLVTAALVYVGLRWGLPYLWERRRMAGKGGDRPALLPPAPKGAWQ